MFRTKKDVDRHCQEVLSKCKNEKEKNLRSLSLAQQYFNVHDYESAKQYVVQYLTVNDNSPVAHKLLARCHEYFGEKEKALTEYKYSLKLDPKQSELILKVCELLSDNNISADKDQINYWCDKAENQFPYHPSVFKLKQKACMQRGNGNPESFEAAMLEQVKSRSHDVNCHTQLLKFYIENGRIRDAYDKAFHHELNYEPDGQWYECGIKICKLYKTQFPSSLNEEYYAHYLLVSERLLALSVQDVKIYRKSIPECVALSASFDEILSAATSLLNKSERFLSIINHMCGQLCFHLATLVYRKAKWEDKDWPNITQLNAPLLLLSSADKFKIREVKKDGAFSKVLKLCFQHNVYRISQAGFVLLSLAKDSQKKFIEKIFHFGGTSHWKERIFEKIYSTSNYKQFVKTSFFMNYNSFSDLPEELPKNILDDINQYVLVTEIVQPASLHHLVWLGVQYLSLSKKDSIIDSYIPPKFAIRPTNSLQFSPNLNSSGYAESLSTIDVEAYLYACIFSAKSSLTHQTIVNNPNSDFVLPADVSKVLCSPLQEEWWEYMCMMTNQSVPEEDYSRARSVVQRGLENIRLLGNCSLPFQLLILLGRTFANKATIESDSDRASALESRALLYWRSALPTLKQIIRNESYSVPSKPLFEYHGKMISKADATKLYAEGKRFEGMLSVKEKNYSESMFLNDSYEEVENVVLVDSPKVKSNSFDETLLQSVHEQNVKIMDKLETLYSKHELLSSNQLQLFEMMSMLSKKLEDVLIMPNEGYLDSLTAAEQLPSPQNPVSVGPSPASTFKPSAAVLTQPLTGNGLYPIQPNVQTGFPRWSLPHSTIPLISGNAVAFPSAFPPYVPLSTPQMQVPVPFPNNQFMPDTKESYTMINRSIASTSVLNTSTPFASTPHKSPLGVSKQTVLNEAFERGHNNMLREILNNSVSKEPPQFSADEDVNSEFARGRLNGAIDFVQKCKMFEGDTSTEEPTTYRAAPTASPSSHSFQIPNITPVVQSPSVQVPEDEEESDDGKAVEHDPIPDFKPIIPLPDEVDVKTGEEEEEVLFENRAKLFRFVDKEWKERGTGTLKILKNSQTGRVRILMRRDIVHKVCANHFLSEEMNLTPMTSSDRAWVYCAADFADEKMNIEKLCVKFKTVELANEFYKVFNESKKSSSTTLITSTTTSKKADAGAANENENKTSSPAALTSTLPSSDAGPMNKSSSPADKTTRKVILAPPVVRVEEKDDNKTVFGGFTFSGKLIISDVPEKKDEEKVKEKKKTPFSSFPGFSLSSFSQTTESKLFQNTIPTTTFSKIEGVDAKPFASVKNTIDFSTLSKNADPSAFVKSKDFKGFEGAGSLVFGGVNADTKRPPSSHVEAILKNVTDRTEAKDATQSPNVKNESCASNDDEFVPTAEFAPAIPMPDLVEIKTGEEGLEVLYEGQCKLFRFVENEWKERGVGKMKILRDNKDGSVRLLMRRDQVHKVCCNHRLTKEHELQSMKTTDKAWTWYAQDFSEGEVKNELLCIRFKTVEQAKAFKKAYDEAKANLSTTKSEAKSTSETLPSLSQMFKRDQNSWECKVCYVVNKADVDECAACSTPKEGSSSSSKPLAASVDSSFSSPKTSIFGGSFGVSSSLTGFSPATTTSASTGFGFTGSSATISTTGNVFTFGMNVSSQINPVSTSQYNLSQPSQPTFDGRESIFGSRVTSFGIDSRPGFGSSSESKVDSPKSETAFSLKKSEPATSSIFSTSQSNLSQSYQPIFSFGGLASQKLDSGGAVFGSTNFSFGNKSDSTQPALSFFGTPHEPKVDSSGNESALNLKKSEPFKSIFGGTGTSSPGNPNIPSDSSSEFSTFSFKLDNKQPASVASDDIEFVSETTVSDEDKKLAESLMLPSNFYNYKYSEKNCPGCVGCENDPISPDNSDKNQPETSFTVKLNTKRNEQNESVVNPSTNATVPSSIENTGFVFGGAGENSSWFSKTTFNFGNVFNRNEGQLGDLQKPIAGVSDDQKDGGSLNKPTFTFRGNFPRNDNEAGDSSPKKAGEDGSDDEKDTSVVSNDHDPYFEPVVPLPKIVEIKTGEEDEIVEFCERSKLFRYDEEKKEWKERGVGELKILYHPVEKSYRFLLRREQVHKVVLNQRITTSLALQPLSSSGNSWCWFGMNWPEESDELVVEKLAARFKNEEISKRFQNVVDNCISQLNANSVIVDDDHVDDDGNVVVHESEEEEYDENAYNKEEYDENGYYVDEEGIEDAMEELGDNAEIIFESPVSFEIFESDNMAAYDCNLRVVTTYGSEEEEPKSFFVISTAEIKSMYKADVVKSTSPVLENDCVILVDEDNAESSGKITLRFPNDKLADHFYNLYEKVKT